MKNKTLKLSLVVLAGTITFSGCSNKDMQVMQLEKQLQTQKQTISTQKKSLDLKTSKVNSLQDALNKSNALNNNATSTPEIQAESTIIDNASLIPPNAKTGECYAKVLIPAQYATKSEQKLLTSSVQNIYVTKPTYKNVDYTILSKAESFKYTLTPATYKCVKNRVMVEPEKITYKIIPATFKEVEETIMISPAQQVWKKGSGPISKIDNHTGDIMCLIEEPAKYKTIKTKVVDEPARTEKIITPAVYKNIKAKVIDQEASYEKVIIPAVYKTITVQELNTEAVISNDENQETFQTVTSTYLEKSEELKWERILCQTNTNGDVIKSVQQALADKNYKTGNIDGIYGSDTRRALTSFQIDNGLASGALTLETLDALNIN